MEFTKTFVTPEYALKLLEKNTMNRPCRQAVVDHYAKEMSSGNWMEDTGEAIKFSKEGKLLDGQHRLMAVVKSGKGQNFHFVHGLDESTFHVLDTGAKRSPGDIMNIAGIDSGGAIASIISCHHRLKNGKFHRSASGHGKSSNLSATDLLKIYNQNPTLWKSIHSRSDFYYRNLSRVIERSLLGGLYTLFYHVNPSDADDFMTQLSTGEKISNKSISLLRKKLIDAKLSPQLTMPVDVKIGLIIKTWNYFRQGREMKILKYAPLEEQFPIAS